MDAAAHVEGKAKAAKEASRVLALASTRAKNEALAQMARGLEERTGAILDANRHDLERVRAAGHARAFVDRLTLTEGRIEEMAAGLRHVASLPDPVGETVETVRRPSGLEIARVRVPLGVIGFIYESRPNVTADAAGLCLKSGNAVLLRGGSEALESNTLLAQILGKAVEKAGLPPEVVQAVESGQSFTAAGIAVKAYGGLHAEIHPEVPRVPNLGFLINDEVYHPGDSFDVPDDVQIDTLFVPVSAPWLKLAEAVAFVRAVAPRRAFALHDSLLSDVGHTITDANMSRLSRCEYARLEPGTRLP